MNNVKLFLVFTLLLLIGIKSSANKKYDIVVSLTGKDHFKSIQAAINSVPDCKSSPTIIFIKKGTYHEKIIVPSSKTNITLIGEDSVNTIISYNDYNPKVKGTDTISTWTSYTFAVDAEGFIAENITFENSAGRVGQAVAVRVTADKVIFRNCRFLGNQDTLFAHGIGRMWFCNCYIEGTTDFIFGSAIALFENCEVHSKSNSYITAASTPKGNTFGYVFKNCRLTADSGVSKVFLGRPWRDYAKTVFINCYLGAHIRAEGWHNWGKPEREITTFYAEYGNFGPGADTALRVKWAKVLSPNEEADYSIEKIFSRSSVPIPVQGYWYPAK